MDMFSFMQLLDPYYVRCSGLTGDAWNADIAGFPDFHDFYNMYDGCYFE